MWVKLLKSWKNKPVGERIDIEDADVVAALIASGIAEHVPNPIGDTIAQAFEKAMTGLAGMMGKTFDEMLMKFMKASTMSRRNGDPLIFGEGQTGDRNKTFGMFLKAVRLKDNKTLEEMGSRFVEWEMDTKTPLSTQSGSTGGYAVPTEHYDRIMMLVTERSIVRKRAFVLPMGGRELEVPALDHATPPSAGNSAFLGGVTMNWTEEATNINPSEPNLKQTKVINYELSGLSRVSNTMMQDGARPLERFLLTLFARAIAWYEDYAFLRGDGVGKPLGVQTWPGFIAVTRSAANAFALADWGKMLGRWMGSWDPRTCCAILNNLAIEKAVTMNASGTGSPAVFLPDGQVTEKIKWIMGGVPVEISEKVPVLGTQGDIGIYDFGTYIIGDREQMEIAFSEHAAFATNQTLWRFVQRVGGQPWLKAAVTLSDGATTISPYVGLAA
jgi:HK97 family phage major capsid protein